MRYFRVTGSMENSPYIYTYIWSEAQEGEEARKYGNDPDLFDIMYGDASHRYVDTKLKTRVSRVDTWIMVTLSCVKRTPLMLRENATRFMGTSGVEETIDQGRVRILRA